MPKIKLVYSESWEQRIFSLDTILRIKGKKCKRHQYPTSTKNQLSIRISIQVCDNFFFKCWVFNIHFIRKLRFKNCKLKSFFANNNLSVLFSQISEKGFILNTKVKMYLNL